MNLSFLKMKLIILIFLSLLSEISFSQCDSSLMAAKGTYNVIVRREAVDFIGLKPRELTCEELIYMEVNRKAIAVIINLDEYTSVEIFPKKQEVSEY